jgi:hypothetical protein
LTLVSACAAGEGSRASDTAGTSSVGSSSAALTSLSTGSGETSGSSSTSGTNGASSTGAGTSGGSTGDVTSGPDTSGATTGEPFACDPVAADSPILDGLVLYDPAEPHPGDTLTVIVRATNGLGINDAPPMQLEVSAPEGVEVHAPMTVEGGQVLYYFAIPDVQLGDLCVRGLIEGATEIASKITVTPRPVGPPREEGGVFKIVENHLWTCDEQPDWGNEIHVYVLDEQGAPLGGRTVDVRVADSTDLATIYNVDEQPVPSEVITDESGHALFYNYWPISDNGLLVVQLAMAGVASDIATEITTGWWESYMDCKFCDQPLRNVWGHWSHTVTFQRTQGAAVACRVPTDHEGMDPGKCGPSRHIHHHPDVDACWTVP